ncbi:uncharacterized protein N7479_001628 [Penicillium vulpinum]|uniref:uncharacterized protein n=1 Tax=Penicillium vulpinum TaxID=29845 RepID=UPI002548C0EC|nr:uncharacterized protein N7479_001628 [Penicillium vulpinum]KAJ5971710.1 hypothetical protein N7479_001628 [Penicillium vulpinum]
MTSRRTISKTPADTGYSSSESDAAPKRTRRPPSTGNGGSLSDTQDANLHTSLNSSPIVKARKQRQQQNWKLVHRQCLQGFKEADRERDELTRSIQRLEADNARATAKIRQLSDTNDQNLAKIQTLEVQKSNLKQQIDAAQVGSAAGDNLLPIILEVSGNFQYAQSQLEKKIDLERNAEKNKLTFAGFPASDVLQPSWPVYNSQIGSLGTNPLQSYSLPNTLPLTNQQTPTQANQQPLPTVSQYIPQF